MNVHKFQITQLRINELLWTLHHLLFFSFFQLLPSSTLKNNNNTLLVIYITVTSYQSPGDLQSFWEKSKPCTHLSCFSDSLLERFKIDKVRSRMSSVLPVQTLHLQSHLSALGKSPCVLWVTDSPCGKCLFQGRGSNSPARFSDPLNALSWCSIAHNSSSSALFWSISL